MAELGCIVAAVQDEVTASHSYWEELQAVLAEQFNAPLTRRVRMWSLAVLASQTLQASGEGWADLGMRPLYQQSMPALLRGVVSSERHALFSDIIELAGAIGPGRPGRRQ